MSLILPNPRFDAPELFYPGRKPVGTVAIDKSHKLGKRILYYFNANQYDAHDADSSSGDKIIAASGKARRFNANSPDGINFTAAASKIFRRQDFSVAIRFTLPQMSSGSAYVFYSDLRFNIGIGVEGIVGLGVSYYDGGQFKSVSFGNPAFKTPYYMVVTKKASGRLVVHLWNAGGYSNMVIDLNDSILYGNSRVAGFGSRAVFVQQNNLQDVVLHEFTYFSDALIEREAFSLYRDQHQFLISA